MWVKAVREERRGAKAVTEEECAWGNAVGKEGRGDKAVTKEECGEKSWQSRGAGSKAVNPEGQELKLSQRRIKLPRVWGKLP